MSDEKTFTGSSPEGTQRALTVYKEINGVCFWITPQGVDLSSYKNGWEIVLDKNQLEALQYQIAGILSRPW